jgi:pyruvate formate lyase activating enzyme
MVELSGQVFDIERFATKDGPGIRTLVFLKGCNLSCVWCQNPEGQKRGLEIMYYANLCHACGRCIEICPKKAISISTEFKLLTDQEVCRQCSLCVDSCFYGARKTIGNTMTISEVMAEVVKDAAYYESSGGGVTVSGGEPLLQSGFTAAILKACRDEGIHTALETAGAVTWKSFETVLPFLDLVFYDIKCMDPALHKKPLEWTTCLSSRMSGS